eukprot:gene36754-18655_t
MPRLIDTVSKQRGDERIHITHMYIGGPSSGGKARFDKLPWMIIGAADSCLRAGPFCPVRRTMEELGGMELEQVAAHLKSSAHGSMNDSRKRIMVRFFLRQQARDKAAAKQKAKQAAERRARIESRRARRAAE